MGTFEIVLIVLVALWQSVLFVMCGLLLLLYTLKYSKDDHLKAQIVAITKGTHLKEYEVFKSDMITALIQGAGKCVILGVLASVAIPKACGSAKGSSSTMHR